MKKYRLKPRFYFLAAATSMIIAGVAMYHIDTTCTDKLERGEVIRPAAAYAAEIVVEEKPELVNLGEYTITHYCSCPICCGVWAENRPLDDNGEEIVLTASGARAEAGKTIAVDPEIIPFGTTVIIEGQEYVAQDTGTLVKGNHIDIYCDSHGEAWEKGTKTAIVYREE